MADAVVFIVSKSTLTAHRRVLWRVSESDARKICSDERTSGIRHMLCWTAQDIDDPVLNRYVRDTGAYAQVLKDHQVTVLASLATAAGGGQARAGRRRARRPA